MCNLIVGTSVAVVGVILVAVSSYVGYGVVPGIIDGKIIDEVVLYEDSDQMEIFKEIPFQLDFKFYVFTIQNPDGVIDGEVPIVKEQGPYVYKLNLSRLIENIEDDTIQYRRLEYYDFDPEASYPYKEDDVVTITNLVYHSLLQVAEIMFPNLLSTHTLNLLLPMIFGAYNDPILNIKVRDLILDGVPICKNSGLLARPVCAVIRTVAQNINNIDELPDGSLIFSVLGFKHNRPSEEFLVKRGLEDTYDLGRIIKYNGSSTFPNWMNEISERGDNVTSVCNMVLGTDSGIFHPFLKRDDILYATNTDMCRSVALHYQYDTVFKDLPAIRFGGKEWVFDNNESCYCLNITSGIANTNGCLLSGAMELYSCVGAPLVVTFPHFLYADFIYRNGVVGMSPNEEEHGIYVDLEPRTGTVLTGRKRAQFNIFVRPIYSITRTQNLRTTLTPLFWIDEVMDLPDEYVDIVKDRLIRPIDLLGIIIPIIIGISALIALVGIVIIVKIKCTKEHLVTIQN